MSQVILRETGAALTVSATLIDVGGHVGSIYQITKKWGLGINAGYSYGYGFSKQSVTGTAMKAFLSSTYYF